MHELSLMQSVLDRAAAVCAEAGSDRVLSIEVEVGGLCGIVPEAWELAFRAAIPGTPLEHARMIWRIVPPRVECSACAVHFHPDNLVWQCPVCGAIGGKPIEGNDIMLLRMEVAEPCTAITEPGVPVHED
jgi:hydrogenase nickel incorporation protein HypA/HybF